MADKFYWVVGILIAVLVILDILVIIWALNSKDQLIQCQKTETKLCPSYYCPPSNSGLPTTPCVDALTTEAVSDGQTYKILGPNVAYRYDEIGNLMCQNYNIPNNIVYAP